jgi:Carboxypeptidase regulatory-like domain
MTTLVIALLSLLLSAQLGRAPATPERDDGSAEIHGTVTDKGTGQPIVGAVIRLSQQAGEVRRTTVSGADGQFSLTGLNAGTYAGFVDGPAYSASHLAQPLVTRGGRPLTLATGQVLEHIDVALPRALAMSVRVVDEWGEPLSGISVSLAGASSGRSGPMAFWRLTDDRGRLRLFGLPSGVYTVCAENRLSGAGLRDGPADRLVRTCFPSATDEREAEPVRLEGGDHEGLEIVMQRTSSYSISGMVLDSNGAPAADARVVLDRSIRGGSSGSSVQVGPDGRFVVNGVLPGRYGLGASLGGRYDPSLRRAQESAYLSLEVSGSDVEGLVLTMARVVDVAGRFVLEDPSQAPPPRQGGGFLVAARLVGDDVFNSQGVSRASAGDDLRFELTSMFGRRLLSFANVPRGWFVKSVQYEGKDVLDTPTEFKGDPEAAGITVVLSNRGATLTGRVIDGAGQVVAGGRVLVLEADAARRHDFVPVSAAISAGGIYLLGPLRPGDYLIAAIGRGVQPPQPDDAESLAALFEGAERITLTEQELRTVDVRLKPR